MIEVFNILFANSSADFRKIQSMHNYTRPQNESVHTYKIKLLAQPWIISLLYCLVHTCREKIGEKIAVQIVYVINRLPNTADGQHYARDRCFIRTTQHCTVNNLKLWALFNTNSIPSKKIIFGWVRSVWWIPLRSIQYMVIYGWFELCSWKRWLAELNLKCIGHFRIYTVFTAATVVC